MIIPEVFCVNKKYPDLIVIGDPLVSLESLGFDDTDRVEYEYEEVFIPRILKKYGFFSSTSDVKRNRPDLWREVSFPEFTEISIGHKRLWLLIGEKEE